MSDPRWRRMWELFHEAAERPAAQRSDWLLAHCEDPELRREVAELLAASAGGPLEDAARFLPLALAGRQDESPAGGRIGPYRLIEPIGAGGMGIVYLAEQEEPVRRTVALKLVKLGMDTREVVARFAAERQALARMDHPGIAAVHDAGTTADGRPYFVMEHVPGLPIDAYCDRARLDVRRRVELAIAVCRAVQHAHQKGIVHRDLKPSNVLVVERDGEPAAKVIDFGIAKAVGPPLTDGAMRTVLGTFLGTPEFMSPEQAGGALDVDTRSDVYSLGALLYTLLVGRPPFDGEALRGRGLAELQRMLREDDPPRPSARFARMPAEEAAAVAAARRTAAAALGRALAGDLDSIVMKAMEKDRERRYDSAAQLASDLGRYLTHQPVVAGPPSRAYRLRKLVRRHRVAVAGGAAAALLLLAFGIGMGLQARRITTALDRAESERQRAEAVSGFLVELFEASDPELGRGAEITARELLDQGAARLPHELAGQPQLQSLLSDVLGRVYQGLGLYDRARTLQERALAHRRAGGDPAALAASLDGLGVTRGRQGDYAGARRLLDEALALQRRHLAPEDPALATTLHHLGEVLHDEGDYAGAERRYRQALALRERALGPRHRDVAHSLKELSVLQRDRGEYVEAERLARRALEIRRGLFGEEHPAVADALEAVGLALHYRRDYAAAEPLLRRALAVRERLLGPDNVGVGLSLAALGLVLKKDGRPVEAEPLLRRSLAIYRRTFGDEHPYVASAVNNLAGAVADNGDHAAAEALYREALARWRQSLGEDHPNLAAGYSNLARAIERQGRLAEAEPLLRRALDVDRAQLGDEHPFVGDDWHNLGRVLAARGAHAAAEEPLRRAIAIRRGLGPAGHRDLLESLVLLGGVLARRGEGDEAEATLREAVGVAAQLGEPGRAARAAAEEALREALASRRASGE